MVQEYTNKSKRLLNIFEAMNNFPVNQTMESFYHSYLNLPKNKPQSLLKSVIEIHNLIDELEVLIKQQSYPNEEYYHINPFRHATRPLRRLDLSRTIESIKRDLNDTQVNYFKTTMNLLSEIELEEIINHEELMNLISEIDKLYTAPL